MAEEAKLSAAQRGKIRRLSQPRELAPDEEGGELNIVPFLDIITNVLMFVLATVSVTFTATIDTNPPDLRGSTARPPSTPSLGLTITVVPAGFSLKTRNGNVAPGCENPGPGLAVGRATNAGGRQDYDYSQLNKCVTKLKRSSETAKDETHVVIAANPEIPYQTIISTIDAVRDGEGGESLFPDVGFAMVK